MALFLGQGLSEQQNLISQIFFFEFEAGKATIRQLCSTPDEDARCVQLCRNPEILKTVVLRELIGVEDMATACLEHLRLPRRHLGVTLAEKKLESLAAKYHSIPADKIWYYPEPPSQTVDQEDKSTGSSAEELEVEERTVGEIRAELKEKAQKEKERQHRETLQIKEAKKSKSTKKQPILQLEPGQRSLLSFIQFDKP